MGLHSKGHPSTGRRSEDLGKARSAGLSEIDPARNPARIWPDDEREKTVDDEDDDPFLRARKRVPLRGGRGPRNPKARIALSAALIAACGALVLITVFTRSFFLRDPRFRIASGSNISAMGISRLSRHQLLAVFGSDIGRNIFFVPLAERQAELERLPWVAHATVMRLLPNQVRVSVIERVPAAFLHSGNSVELVDGDGVLLPLSPTDMEGKHYSFPVVYGISANDPLSLRAARMHLYQQFVAALDVGEKPLSSQLSEVDISDPEDIRALLPAGSSDLLVHFGDGDYLARYQLYREHLPEWQRLYPHLASVDMRFENQVVLGMAHGVSVPLSADGGPIARPTPQPAAKEAIARAPIHAVPRAGAAGQKAANRSQHRHPDRRAQ